MSRTSWAQVVGTAGDIEEDKSAEHTKKEAAHYSPEPELPADPKAQRRQRLLQQALKSRVNAVTGERWCLGCGRVFSDISKLAQHIADKHGGINGTSSSVQEETVLHKNSNPAPKLSDVAVVRREAAGASEKQQQRGKEREGRPPKTSLRPTTQEVTTKKPASAAATFQAPEGTHAKKKKRPSKLKRGYTKARAQQAVAHWQDVLMTIEHALVVSNNLEESIRNELVSGELTTYSEALPGVWTVQVQILHKRLELAEEQRQQLHSARLSARERLEGALAVLNPPQPPAPALKSPPTATLQLEHLSLVKEEPQVVVDKGPAESIMQPPVQPVAAVAATDTIWGRPTAPQAAALRENDGSSRSSSSDESDSSDLGGFVNVLGQWAEQSGADRAPYYGAQRIEEDVVGQDAVQGTEDIIEVQEAEGEGEESSSSDTSSEGSFGLQWGDTLRVWAQGVGAEAHASLLVGQASGSGGGGGSGRGETWSPNKVEVQMDTLDGFSQSLDKLAMHPNAHVDAPSEVANDEQQEAVQATREEGAMPPNAPIESALLPAVDHVTLWVQNISEFVPQSMRTAASVASAVPPTQSLPSAPIYPPNYSSSFNHFHCHLCGVTATGQRPWEEHLASRRHSQRVQQAATASIEVQQPIGVGCVNARGTTSQVLSTATFATPATTPTTTNAAALLPPTQSAARRYVGADADVAPYVDHIITPEINNAVEALLRQLLEWQERTRRLDPVNARRKRRLVSGLREVEKAVKGRKAKVLIVAPNIQALEIKSKESSGGLDGVDDQEENGEKEESAAAAFPVHPMLVAARESGTPIVFALSRQRMGKLMGQRKRASAFAVLDASGAETQLRTVLELVAQSRGTI